MSVGGHLQELRKRLILALSGIAVGAIAGWFLFDPIMAFIQRPLVDLGDVNVQLNYPTIGAALDLQIRVALWAGVVLSCPWWIYQIGAFISPGLKRKEKLGALIFGLAGVVLFLGGAATGVWLAPRAVQILQSFVPDDSVSLLQASAYVDFYLRLVLVFGASFLIPEVLVALNFAGALSARSMLKAWRWAVVAAFTFAAIANPLPSPWPMIVQAGVLIGLYLLAVLISWLRERYVKYGKRLRPPKEHNAKASG